MVYSNRFFKVRQATNQMAMKLLEMREEHGLTVAEYLDFLAAEMRGELKYVLREEEAEELAKEE